MLTTMYDAVRFNLDKKYETSFIRLSLIRTIGFVQFCQYEPLYRAMGKQSSEVADV